jgi:hypothetical protein
MSVGSYRYANRSVKLSFVVRQIHIYFLESYMVIYLSMALQSYVGPRPLSRCLILYTVGRTPWTGDQPVARPLPTHRTTQTQNKRTQTSMPLVGFEPTIPDRTWISSGNKSNCDRWLGSVRTFILSFAFITLGMWFSYTVCCLLQ